MVYQSKGNIVVRDKKRVKIALYVIKILISHISGLLLSRTPVHHYAVFV